MDKNRPNNARKATDRKNPTASRPENDENKQPSQTNNKNGVRQTSDKRVESKKPENSTSVQAKGPQATAEQLRMAQMSQVASASDIVLAEKIKQVKELTQCTDDDAATALHDTGNDTELAVNQILEGGTNKSEWETTGKKGKKKPKAKQEETNDSSLQDSQFVGYVSNSRINSSRGRQAQRNTSNRGGRGGAAPSAPRTSQQEESSNFNGGSQRTFPPGDRPSSPQAGRSVREDDDRGRGGPDGKKPDQERIWGEDADDDWKESIRETKVFTRSSPNVPPSNSVPQQGPSRAPQPATVGSSGPSFSAMVQKQSQQSAWTNANVPTGGSTTQRLSVSDTANWKQPTPSAASKAPSSSGTVPDHVSSTGGSAGGAVPQSTIPAVSQKESTADVSQLGLQFGNMAFNRTSYEARNEASNQVPNPSQSQTYNSRPSFVHPSRDQAPSDQASTHRPTALPHPSNPAADLSRSQNVGSSGFAVPTQTLTFGHSEQDTPTNTYSAKNIQSTPAFAGSQQPASVLPSRSPGGNFAEQRSGSSSGPAVQAQNSALPTAANSSSVTSMQDSRFGQQSSGNVLSKSPAQVPTNRQDISSFGQQTQQKTQPSNQSPIQTEQFSQSALHQSLPTAMRQTVPGGYGGYGLSTETASRHGYSAFSSPNVPAVSTATQKDAATNLQQQSQSQLQSGNQMSSVTTGTAPRTSTTATSVFNTGSKPTAVPSSSLSFKQSTYAAQPSPSSQSLQQQYLQQGQQQYGQQASLPMFPQMYGTGLEGMTDPRLQSVTLQQQGLGLEYGSYQNSLTGRDPSGLGYSAADPAKYRNDPMAGVQTQVSQQQALVGPHLGQPYQSYIQYSPAAVPQNYGYGPTPVYPTNIPSAYGKGGASLGSNYPGSSYPDMSALTDVNKVSNAYGTTGLRGFGNEGYLGNPGILTGAADLQSAYYGNKAGNKFEKPSQNFGMHLPGGQQTTAAYGGQYYPPNMMQQQQQQQQLHQMGQVPQNSAGQNLGNNKQNKGTNQSYAGQNWGHQ